MGTILSSFSCFRGFGSEELGGWNCPVLREGRVREEQVQVNMLRLRGLKQLCEDVKWVVCYASLKLSMVVWAGDIYSVFLCVEMIFKTMELDEISKGV